VTSQFDPAALKTRTEMAARSLGIKINEGCFLNPRSAGLVPLAEFRSMVLDDANAHTLRDQLTKRNALNLMNQLSYTTMGGGGAYSAYIAPLWIRRGYWSSLHTAHFQYIPALRCPGRTA